MNSLLRFPYFFIVIVLLAPIRIISFIATLLFFFATPTPPSDTAFRLPLPATWDATFSNSGKEIAWYAMDTHQPLFILTMALLILSTLITIVLHSKRNALIKTGQIVPNTQDPVGQLFNGLVFMGTAVAFLFVMYR